MDSDAAKSPNRKLRQILGLNMTRIFRLPTHMICFSIKSQALMNIETVKMDLSAVRTARVASAALRASQSSKLSRIPLATATCLYGNVSLQPSRHITSPPSQRTLSTSTHLAAPTNPLFGNASSSSTPSSYFQRPSLPANTIIRFVPQQTAWIVERMGKFNRILQPGLAVLLPFLDRIAYVKSLKEAAIEIPSQSAITADNVTLELDGVLYTRVFDAYKARYVSSLNPELPVPVSLS